MNQLDVLLHVANKLKELEIGYMLTGSYAVSFYGKPRTTHDIDLKVEIDFKDAKKIFGTFSDSFYVSEEAIKDAIKRQSMFNIIENESQTKVDFWVVKNTDFDKKRFSRRILADIHNVPVYISTAEDTIIVKLLWYKESDINKHFDDALGVIQIQRGKLDMNYIKQWCQRLSIDDLCTKLFSEKK